MEDLHSLAAVFFAAIHDEVHAVRRNGDAIKNPGRAAKDMQYQVCKVNKSRVQHYTRTSCVAEWIRQDLKNRWVLNSGVQGKAHPGQLTGAL